VGRCARILRAGRVPEPAPGDGQFPDGCQDRRTGGSVQTGANDLTALWERLESLLSERAPGDHAALRPGASGAELEELEENLGFAPHPGLRTLLTRHNGVTARRSSTEPGAFLLNYSLLDAAGVLENQRLLASMEQDAVDEGDGDLVSGRIAHRMWVPFATSFSGDMLFVDHRTGAHYGEIGGTNFGDPDYLLLWAGLETMLCDLCDGIENGSPVGPLRQMPLVYEGRMLQWMVAGPER
jgi:cell wall assembly regulator SMI1